MSNYSALCPKCDSTRVLGTLERPDGTQYQTCHRGHLSQSREIDYMGACGNLLALGALDYQKAKPAQATIATIPESLTETVLETPVIEINALAPIPRQISPWGSLDGSKTAMAYQIEGVEFCERAHACALIADEMGLGKTIQAALLIRRNAKILSPVLILCPAQIIYQWAQELRAWTVSQDDITGILPIGNREQIFPGFQIYIMSQDLIGRAGIADKLKACKIKSVVIDECHRLKDRDAKRTRAIVRFCRENDIQFRIGLSGTPIKNRVSEFWSIFNILYPAQFTSYSDFCNWYLVRNEKNQYTRLNPAMEETFRNMTANFMIRRKKADVLTNLPAITRDYQIIEIEDESLRDSYNHKLGLFQAFLNSPDDDRITSQAILGWLAQMRQITGQAKIMNALQWTEDFLESTEESILIGTLHDAVRDALYFALANKKVPVAKLSGENNSWEKDRIITDFRAGNKRALVINMKAGGEGLNLQTASNLLVIERQWNAADEEQFEARIHRMGQNKPCTATYMIAKGTIDEFLHDLIMQKRRDCAKGYGESLNLENDSLSSLLEFSNFVCSHRI